LAFFEKNKTAALSALHADKIATPFLWFVFRTIFPCPKTRDFFAYVDQTSTLYPAKNERLHSQTQFDRERGRSFPGKVQA